MLREAIADLVRKGKAKEPLSSNENTLLKDYLRTVIQKVGPTEVKTTSYEALPNDRPVCEAIQKVFPGTWLLIWKEKRKG